MSATSATVSSRKKIVFSILLVVVCIIGVKGDGLRPPKGMTKKQNTIKEIITNTVCVRAYVCVSQLTSCFVCLCVCLLVGLLVCVHESNANK